MPYFMQLGDVPRKRFSQHRKPDGSLYATEVMGEEGFSADFSLLFHQHSPSDLLRCEAVDSSPTQWLPNQPLQPRLFNPQALPAGDAFSGRHVLLGNADVSVAWVHADQPSGLHRNAIGDELWFVHEGEATLETVFGSLTVGAGDYVVIPKAVTHAWLPQPGKSLRALLFETSGHVRSPARYLSDTGQYLQVAPYSEPDLRRPTAPLLREGSAVPVLVKTRHGLTRHVMARHPFDVAGWFGCNYPFALNIADFSPVSGSFHRPPPVHQVFEAPGLVLCNFVPRVLDYDPRAVPLPSFHSNVDSDELIFYAEGNFFSRKGAGIARGALSLHPAGHIHGPHPGAIEGSLTRIGQRTEEVAVMLDTFQPLQMAASAVALEDARYVHSWHGDSHA